MPQILCLRTFEGTDSSVFDMKSNGSGDPTPRPPYLVIIMDRPPGPQKA